MYFVPLLGLVATLYAVIVLVIAIKKPASLWNMKKISFLRKLLGEKGTVFFFYIWSAGFLLLGVLLILTLQV